MPYRYTTFLNQSFYHIFNRGVAKQNIFHDENDYRRFLESATYYQYAGPKPSFSSYKRFRARNFRSNPKIVDVVSYCLMPNHFHFLLRQTADGGIQEFIRKVTNAYSKYFNTKNKRVGPILQGEFKSIPIESEELLLHISRYIHLNPYASELVDKPECYLYSSYPSIFYGRDDELSLNELVLEHFKEPLRYVEFVNNQADYARMLSSIKHLTFEDKE